MTELTLARLLENVPQDERILLRRQIYGMLKEYVGVFKQDSDRTLAEQYEALSDHHIKETEFLITLLIKWGHQVRAFDNHISYLDEMIEN